MLSILRKTTASSSKTTRSTSHNHSDDELSTWELVNHTVTDDEEDLYSFDGDDDVIIQDLENGAACELRESVMWVSPPTTFPIEVTRRKARFDDEVDDVIIEQLEMEDACESREFATCVSPPTTFAVEVTLHQARFDDDVEEEKHDYDEDDVYDDDVDDDLVPWELKGRFGKQRIKKIMGKKCLPKPNRSNKLPCYYHNKPKAFTRRVTLEVQPLFVELWLAFKK